MMGSVALAGIAVMMGSRKPKLGCGPRARNRISCGIHAVTQLASGGW
jgi:hypothetical protein